MQRERDPSYHQIPISEDSVQLHDRIECIVLGCRRHCGLEISSVTRVAYEKAGTDRQFIRCGISVCTREVIKGISDGRQEIQKALALRLVWRVLKVYISTHALVEHHEDGERTMHIHAIESIILDDLNDARSKVLAESAIGEERKVAILRIRPTANRQQDFEVSFRSVVSSYSEAEFGGTYRWASFSK